MTGRRIFVCCVISLMILAVSSCTDKGSNVIRQVAVNSPAPEFNARDISGRPWSLSGLRGKVVLMNFWATWCPPCVEEMPSLHELSVLASGADEFQILTVLFQDSSERAAAFFSNNGYSMPVLIDPGGRIALSYGITGIPVTIVVDKKGVVREKYLGPQKFDSPEIVAFLNSLLEE